MSMKSEWNFVKRMMQTPCHNGSIGLYIETGVQAAGIAALDILSFGCREPLKHAAGRGQAADYFGTGNRRGLFPPHRRPKVPKGKVVMPAVSSGASFFWGFEAAAERALFYYFLYEVGKEFFINWTSLLYQANGCNNPANGFCVFDIKPQVVGPNPTDLLIGPTAGCHGVLSDTRAVYIPQGITTSIGYSANAVPWPPQPDPAATLETHLNESVTGLQLGASRWENQSGIKTGVTNFVQDLTPSVGGYRRISVSGRTGGGLVWIPKGKLTVSLKGHHEPAIHVSDCFKSKGH